MKQHILEFYFRKKTFDSFRRIMSLIIKGSFNSTTLVLVLLLDHSNMRFYYIFIAFSPAIIHVIHIFICTIFRFD